MRLPWRRAPEWLGQLHDLLLTPDLSKDRRGHRVTCPGRPDRRSAVLLPLLTRWAVTRQVLNDAPPFIGRAKKGFRLIVADRRRRA